QVEIQEKVLAKRPVGAQMMAPDYLAQWRQVVDNAHYHAPRRRPRASRRGGGVLSVQRDWRRTNRKCLIRRRPYHFDSAAGMGGWNVCDSRIMRHEDAQTLTSRKFSGQAEDDVDPAPATCRARRAASRRAATRLEGSPLPVPAISNA